jgi:predicted metal-dependent peptidase
MSSTRPPAELVPILRQITDAAVGLGTLLLFARWGRDERHLAATDGDVIVVSERLFALPQNEQCFVLAHEALHIALAHPMRARRMTRRLQSRGETFDATLWNIAADAIINHALTDLPRVFHAPAKIVTFASLRVDAKRTWSVEALYETLAAQAQRPKAQTLCTSGCSVEPGAFGGEPVETGDESEARHLSAWNGRLGTAFGKYPTMLARIRGDLGASRVPWERALRAYVGRCLGATSRKDFARLHRRYTARARVTHERFGLRLPFEWATQRRVRPRLAVMVDTSGSISDETLGRFTSEIIGLMRVHRAALRLIVCDAKVHQICDLSGPGAERTLRTLTYAGGGGTDFAPAIAAAADFDADVGIFFTDLCGDFGAKPAFDVVWIAQPGFARDVPFGRVIAMN